MFVGVALLGLGALCIVAGVKGRSDELFSVLTGQSVGTIKGIARGTKTAVSTAPPSTTAPTPGGLI